MVGENHGAFMEIQLGAAYENKTYQALTERVHVMN